MLVNNINQPQRILNEVTKLKMSVLREIQEIGQVIL